MRTARNLKVVLTEPEILERSRMLAKTTQDLEQVEKAKAEVMADFTHRIKAAKSISASLSCAIANGYEYREVDCEWIYDWLRGTKELRRCDTDELIETAAIAEDERQEHLAFDDRAA